jgi:hypothetical protein
MVRDPDMRTLLVSDLVVVMGASISPAHHQGLSEAALRAL